MASTSSPLSVSSGSPTVLGSQRPRVLLVPDFDTTSGDEALELASTAGLEADEWQRFVMVNALGERADASGRAMEWAAGEVGVEVARQNGKGGLLEIRELAGLFLFGEKLLIHSAHEFATAEEALERMIALLEANTELWKRVRAIKRSHGQEGIYLKSGQRLRYRTRTKGGGRGWSADWVGLDEAMHIPEAMHGALMPTLSAMPNPQLWYTGSAVDQFTMDNGRVFARVRARALRGEDPNLAYFGWSAPFERPDQIPAGAAADPAMWAIANPGLGIRLSLDWTAKEHASMDPRTFAVERLGVGDWPAIGDETAEISLETWATLEDPASKPLDPVCFAFDATPDRSSAAVAAAGKRADGRSHVEVIRHDRGVGWIVDYLVGRVERHRPAAVLCDAAGPAGSLMPALHDRGIEVLPVNAREHAQAFGLICDLCAEDQLRHIGQPELVAALKGATKRRLGEAFAWSRRDSSVDISPLVAGTLALWGTATNEGAGVWVSFT